MSYGQDLRYFIAMMLDDENVASRYRAKDGKAPVLGSDGKKKDLIDEFDFEFVT